MDRSALFTLALLVGIAALFSVNFASTDVAAFHLPDSEAPTDYREGEPCS